MLGITAATAEGADWQLKALWPMDSTYIQSGGIVRTGMQDIIGGHDGNINQILLTPNGIDQAYVFNGTAASRAVVESSTELEPGPKNFHVSVFVHPAKNHRPAVGRTYNLIRKQNSGSGWSLAMNHGGRVECTFASAWQGALVSVTLSGGESLDDGTWRQIQCFRIGNLVQLQVGIAIVAKRTIYLGAISNQEPVVFGGDGYKGSLDGPYIYKR